MKRQTYFRIGIVRPGKAVVLDQRIKATDRAWRTAIFGMGGSKKRIAGAKLGMIDGQPIAVIGELPDEVVEGTPIWTIQADDGLFAFAGNCAVYNDLGYGPATLGLDLERLRELINFDPEPEALQDGLRRTIQARTPKDG